MKYRTMCVLIALLLGLSCFVRAEGVPEQENLNGEAYIAGGNFPKQWTKRQPESTTNGEAITRIVKKDEEESDGENDNCVMLSVSNLKMSQELLYNFREGKKKFALQFRIKKTSNDIYARFKLADKNIRTAYNVQFDINGDFTMLNDTTSQKPDSGKPALNEWHTVTFLVDTEKENYSVLLNGGVAAKDMKLPAGDFHVPPNKLPMDYSDGIMGVVFEIYCSYPAGTGRGGKLYIDDIVVYEPKQDIFISSANISQEQQEVPAEQFPIKLQSENLLDCESIVTDNITLEKEGVQIPYTIKKGQTEFSVLPAESLRGSSRYRLTIHGIRDVYGTEMTNPYILNFQTTSKTSVENFGFFDTNDTKINQLNGIQVISCKASVRNNAKNSLPIHLILAYYDKNGYLLDIEEETKEIAGRDSDSLEVEYDRQKHTEGYARAFLVKGSLSEPEAFYPAIEISQELTN